MTSTSVIDLKCFQPVRHLFWDTRKEMTHVHWQTHIFTSNGLYAHSCISSLRHSLSGRPQCPKLHLSRSLSLYGFCSANISGKPPRYRSLSSCTTKEVVPHGHSWHHSTIKPGRCQRASGVAYICRPCPCINHHSTKTLQQRTIRDRSAANAICSGRHYNRSMSLDVPVGYLSPDKSSHQIAYASGFARQHSHVHLYLRRSHARCEHSRCTPYRAGGVLYNGSRISGLCQTPFHITSSRLLCDSGKIQFQMSKNLFSSYRPFNRSSVRPDHHANRILFAQRLPKQTTTRQILRYRNRQNSGFLDQQFLSSSTYYRSHVSLPMAGGTLFQMDQAKPAHQKFLWHFGERCQNSNLDRSVSIRLGSYTQKTTQYPGKSLYDSTNLKRLRIRKNAFVTTTYRSNFSARYLGFQKPVEFIHLTVGH